MFNRKKNKEQYMFDPMTGKPIELQEPIIEPHNEPRQTRRERRQIQGDYEEILINTPLEYIAFNLPRKAFSLVLLALGGTIGAVGLAFISIFFLNQTSQINMLMQGIQIAIAGLFLFLSFIIYQNTIKRGEHIIIREHRGGVMTFDKQNLRKKVFFDKKDPSTEITVLWNGTAIEKQSGSKIVLIKEGSKSNENLNLCVSETDWNKNLGAMVRAKTFADIAENDLLNTQTLLGLKWQDFALILVSLLTVSIIIILLGVTPDMVAEAVKSELMNGTLQNAIHSIVTTVGVV